MILTRKRDCKQEKKMVSLSLDLSTALEVHLSATYHLLLPPLRVSIIVQVENEE